MARFNRLIMEDTMEVHTQTAVPEADAHGQERLPFAFSKRERPPAAVDSLSASNATKTATATKENPDAD